MTVRKIDALAQSLPLGFQSHVNEARLVLPLLLDGNYRLALTHNDLSSTNLFIDPPSGRITGIVDWAEASVTPFGLSLWSVYNMLGYMDSDGWHYYSNSSALVRLFWEVFEDDVGALLESDRKKIFQAEKLGLLLRYGFVWDGGTKERVVQKSDSLFRFLDAFISYSGRNGS